VVDDEPLIASTTAEIVQETVPMLRESKDQWWACTRFR
jgi:hypothetical protein